MKKLIILLTLVAVSFSADKYQYLIGRFSSMGSLAGFSINEYRVYVREDLRLEINEKLKKYVIESREVDDAIIVLNEALTRLGEDGWELFSIQPTDAKAITNYYFKRNIEGE